MKIYPAMDLLGGKVVRLLRGQYDHATVYADDPLTTLRGFVRDGAQRVHIVDLDGAREGAPTQAALIESLLRSVHVPVQVGGGIRNLAQIESYLRAGADRVVLGTAAVHNAEFLADACRRYAVIVAVDSKDGMVATHGWQKASEVSAEALVKAARNMGAKGVLYTDIARDGTGVGANVEATVALARAVPELEVIASGGIGALEDVASLAARTEIAACVVGRALYEGKFALTQAIAIAAVAR